MGLSGHATASPSAATCTSYPTAIAAVAALTASRAASLALPATIRPAATPTPPGVPSTTTVFMCGDWRRLHRE